MWTELATGRGVRAERFRAGSMVDGSAEGFGGVVVVVKETGWGNGTGVGEWAVDEDGHCGVTASDFCCAEEVFKPVPQKGNLEKVFHCGFL